MARRGDGMRTCAWCCVVAGILIAIGGLAYVPYRDAAIRREIAGMGAQVFLPYSIESRRAAALAEEQARLSHWPGVIAGAGITAFGILLLAIRRPERQQEDSR
jgi:hypothetical protein